MRRTLASCVALAALVVAPLGVATPVVYCPPPCKCGSNQTSKVCSGGDCLDGTGNCRSGNGLDKSLRCGSHDACVPARGGRAALAFASADREDMGCLARIRVEPVP